MYSALGNDPPSFTAQQPSVGQDLLIVEASRSHSETPNSVELLWMCDQPDAETSTEQLTTLTRDGYPCHRRDSNPAIPATELLQTHALDRAATKVTLTTGNFVAM